MFERLAPSYNAPSCLASEDVFPRTGTADDTPGLRLWWSHSRAGAGAMPALWRQDFVRSPPPLLAWPLDHTRSIHWPDGVPAVDPETRVNANPPADLADYEWLVSARAGEWLARASAAARDPWAILPRLRRELSADRARLILEQVDLRARARDKFRLADQMFFSRLLLEQATDEVVAAHKAARFSGAACVADFCCGIGGDLLSLAKTSRVVGVDRSERALLLARANLEALSLGGADSERVRLIPAEVDAAQLSQVDAWHIDPDRRPAGRRTTDPDAHDPPTRQLEQLLAIHPRGGIKLAPAAKIPDRWQAEAELEWIGRGGQCRQLVAWFGGLATHAGQRRATMVGENGGTLVGLPCEPPSCATAPGRFLYEPDATLLASGLAPTLAFRYGLACVAPGIAYLTADHRVRDATLACFELLAVMPFDRRKVKAWLRARNAGRLEVKLRGVALSPEAVRQTLRVPGDQAITLLLSKIRGSVTALLAERRVD